jgi:hypothetical protein
MPALFIEADLIIAVLDRSALPARIVLALLGLACVLPFLSPVFRAPIASFYGEAAAVAFGLAAVALMATRSLWTGARLPWIGLIVSRLCDADGPANCSGQGRLRAVESAGCAIRPLGRSLGNAGQQAGTGLRRSDVRRGLGQVFGRGHPDQRPHWVDSVIWCADAAGAAHAAAIAWTNLC